jgi:hypothetical protein
VNEYDIRLRAISYREGGTRSVPPSSSRFSSLAGEWGSSTPVQFSDLSPTHPAYNAIRNLAQQGILQGYRDGTFKPGATVTRAELIKILVAGLHPKELQKEGRCFKDVRDDWFAPFVCAAKRLAWVGGYTDGSFKPGNPVTRAEALKMIVASMPDFHTTSSIALPRDVRPEAWFAPFVQKAIRLGILRQGSFRPTVNLTRADAALWIHAAMQPTPQQEEVQEESALSEDAAGSNQSQGSPHS